MLENALKILSKSRSLPLEQFLELSLRSHMPRQTRQSPILDPSTLTCPKPLVNHSTDVERLDFHPWKRFVVVSRPLECARQNRSVSHHVFFHLDGKVEWLGTYMRKEVSRGLEIEVKADTHELIPDELIPFLILSFGGDYTSITFKYAP